MDNETKKMFRTLGYISTVGMAMVFSILLGALIGYFADKWLGTSPWLLLVFLGFGIAAAFRNLYILYKKAKDM